MLFYVEEKLTLHLINNVHLLVHLIDNVSFNQCWKGQLRYINPSNTYLIYLHNSVCIINYCISLLTKVFLQVKKLQVTINTGTLSLRFCVNHPGNVLKTTFNDPLMLSGVCVIFKTS